MNIFILDLEPSAAARSYVDRHVPAGILELSQVLSIAHVMLDGHSTAKRRVPVIGQTEREKATGREPYTSHPCAMWARESVFNYCWTAALARSLTQQYTLRFGRSHQMERIVKELETSVPLNIPLIERTPFVKSMPATYRKHDPVRAYREYYFATRQHLAEWRVVGVPGWWVDMIGEKVSA